MASSTAHWPSTASARLQTSRSTPQVPMMNYLDSPPAEARETGLSASPPLPPSGPRYPAARFIYQGPRPHLFYFFFSFLFFSPSSSSASLVNSIFSVLFVSFQFFFSVLFAFPKSWSLFFIHFFNNHPLKSRIYNLNRQHLFCSKIHSSCWSALENDYTIFT